MKNCKDWTKGSVVTVGGNDTLTNSYVFTRDTSANIRVEKTKHIFGERNKIAEAVCFISFNKSTHKASSQKYHQTCYKKYSKPYYLEV